MGVSATLTISDWRGESQTAILFARISIISISPAHQRRETNLWQHKRKHGSGGDEEVSGLLAIYSEGFSPQLRGLPAGDFGWQYTP